MEGLKKLSEAVELKMSKSFDQVSLTGVKIYHICSNVGSKELTMFGTEERLERCGRRF